MRVTYIHQYFLTPEMSGGTRSFEIARRLVQRGHEVHVIAADPSSDKRGLLPRWRRTTEDGIQVHWMNVRYSNHMSFRRRLVPFGLFAFHAAVKACVLRTDVIFASSTPLTVAIPGRVAARRWRRPYVLEVRDVWPELPIALGALRGRFGRRLALRLEAWAYRGASAIVVLSPGMAESITRRFPRVRPIIAPNFADVLRFRSASAVHSSLAVDSSLSSSRIVLYAGALGKANNVRYLVELGAHLKYLNSGAKVVIVGAGAEEEKLRDMARRLELLGSAMLILGPVSKQEIVAWYQKADVCVSLFADIPELQANSPNKVFDAMAAGKPVAINHGGWLGEVLRVSGAGLSMPAGDPRRGAEMIAELLGNQSAYDRAAEASARLGETTYNIERVAHRVCEVLEAQAT